MTFEPRRHYEYGDPVEVPIVREERTDHHRAQARGRRLLLLADELIGVLQASGTVTNVVAARADLFHVLADNLYRGAALDVPDFSSVQSLDAMRRGAPDRDDVR